MLGLAFSLAEALNIVWGTVSEQGVDSLHDRIKNRDRAKRVAIAAAECISRSHTGTVEKAKIKQLVRSNAFVDWLKSGSEIAGQSLDEELSGLANGDAPTVELLRRQIASCVIESFETIVARSDPSVAVTLNVVRREANRLFEEVTRNAASLAERLEGLDIPARNNTLALQGIDQLGRRIDAVHDDLALLVELSKRGQGGPEGGLLRVSYGPELRQYEQFHHRLLGRDGEIAQIFEHLYEPQTGYLVIEGGSWAGKTALVVKLRQVLSAAGWQTVTYYVRESDFDVDSFLDSVNTQFLEMLQLEGGLPWRFAEKRTQFFTLWDRATAQARPLALIIDGFDEQSEDFPLAKLMPRSFGLSGRIVLASRSQPDPTSMVDQTHPLSNPDHTVRFRIDESPHAQVVRGDAERATATLLREDERLAAFIAVAQELTIHELAELSGRTPGQVKIRTTSAARHLEQVIDASGAKRLRWSHRELVSSVNDLLGPSRQDVVDEVVSWCDKYKNLQWSEDTPMWCLRHLDDFARREKLDPFRWLDTDRRERMLRSILHLEPYLEGLYEADRRLRQVGDLPARLKLAADYVDTIERANAVPRSIYVALCLTGEAILAEEAASARLDLVGGPDHLLDVGKRPSGRHIPDYLVADDAEHFLGLLGEGEDPLTRLRWFNEVEVQSEYFAALVWHLMYASIESFQDPEHDEVQDDGRLAFAKKITAMAITRGLDRPLRAGLDGLRLVAKQLALSSLDLAIEIARVHPERNHVAFDLADRQMESQGQIGADKASQIFRSIEPLVDLTPSMVAQLCYMVIGWAPQQATGLAKRVVEEGYDDLRNYNLYGLIQALAGPDPEMAHSLVELFDPGLRIRSHETGRLFALGVVDDVDLFEQALENVIASVESDERVEARDWILSDAMQRLSLRDQPRAITMLDRLEDPRYTAFAIDYLTKRSGWRSEQLSHIASLAEALIDREAGQNDVVVRFALGSVALVDAQRALDIIERWGIRDDGYNFAGYLAVGRLALSDLSAAREYLDRFEYPWHAQVAIARELSSTDPDGALAFCKEIEVPSMRAETRAYIGSIANGDALVHKAFSGALDAFMVQTSTEPFARIVGAMASSGLDEYRRIGRNVIDDLCERWAQGRS